MEIRKPIKRIEVFFSRIDGEYPRLKFFVGETEIPFVRGRLRLEGDLTTATEISVTAEENAPFIPMQTLVPIVKGRVFIQLMPAPQESNVPEAPFADINLPGQEEGTLFDETETPYGEDGDSDLYQEEDPDEFEGKKRASGRTIRILIIACIICIGIILVFFLSDRFISSDPHATDSDSIKTDTLAKDSAQDTAKVDTVALAPAAPTSTPSRGYSGYAPTFSDSYDDTVAEESEPERKKRTLPEGTNLVEDQEH